MVSVFFVPIQYVLILELVRIFSDVLTASQRVARLYVIKGEQLIVLVLVAHVIHPKMD